MADSAPKDKGRSMDIAANRMRRALLKEENQDLFTEYKNCENSEKEVPSRILCGRVGGELSRKAPMFGKVLHGPNQDQYL